MSSPSAPSTSRYSRVRRLGGGGVGTVYIGADSLLGRTVALKSLHGTIDAEILREEARSLARLHHPNVVVLHDLIEDEDGPCLVMEYVEGTDLDAWVTEHGPTGVEKALALLMPVARAVMHAHALGVLHCDIKPSNILLSTAGEIKLTDFTLAHVLAGGRFYGTRGGTAEYAAPEQFTGGPVDERTDVYALGAVLRRLAGPLGDDEIETAVAAAIERATAGDPAERFDSVSAFLDALPSTEDVTRIVPASRAGDLTRILPRRATPARRIGPRTRIAAVALAVAGLAAGAATAAFSVFASSSHVTVPDLVATQSSSAQLVARSLTLHEHIQRVYSATAASGIVVAQLPPAGSTVPAHGTLTLIVSKGPRPVAIPSLADMTERAAIAQAKSLGLLVKIQTDDTILHPAGLVLDQKPAPNVSVLPGTTITITVSKRPWWWFFG